MNRRTRACVQLEQLEPRLFLSGTLGSDLMQQAQTVDLDPIESLVINDTIIAGADGDIYRFVAAATGTILLDFSSDVAMDSLVSVFSSRGRRVRLRDQLSDDPLRTLATLKVKEGRVYYLQANGSDDAAATFTATITGTPKDDISAEFELARELSLRRGKGKGRGTLNYDGDRDVFRLVAPNDGPMTINLLGPTRGAAADLELIVYDAQGDEVARDGGDGPTASISLNVAPDDVYFVEVTGSYEGTKSPRYSLNVLLPRDAQGNTNDRAFVPRMRKGMGKAKGSLDYDGDVDVFSLVANVTGRMTVDISGIGWLSEITSNINVHNAQGELVALVDAPEVGQAAGVSADVQQGEVYYFNVSAGDNQTTGKYLLTFEVRAEPEPAPDVTAPVVTVNGLTTTDTTPTLTGTVDDAGATIEVTVNGQTFTATNNGATWTINWPTALIEGTYNVSVTATDTDGNAGTDTTTNELTIEPAPDVTAPVVTVNGLTTTDTTPTLTGTVDDAGATIEVTVNGQTFTATNNGATWTINWPTALIEGTYNVSVIATDAAGNAGTDTTTNELTIDAPVATTAIVAVDNSTALTGYVTQDIVIDTATDWLSVEFTLTLTGGTIYQDISGGATPPTAAVIAGTPSLEFDTFVSGGGTVDGTVPSFAGPVVMDAEEIDVTFFTTSTADIGTLELARITLSDDATGSFQFTYYTAGTGPATALTVSGTITNGVMTIV